MPDTLPLLPRMFALHAYTLVLRLASFGYGGLFQLGGSSLKLDRRHHRSYCKSPSYNSSIDTHPLAASHMPDTLPLHPSILACCGSTLALVPPVLMLLLFLVHFGWGRLYELGGSSLRLDRRYHYRSRKNPSYNPSIETHLPAPSHMLVLPPLPPAPFGWGRLRELGDPSLNLDCRYHCSYCKNPTRNPSIDTHWPAPSHTPDTLPLHPSIFAFYGDTLGLRPAPVLLLSLASLGRLYELGGSNLKLYLEKQVLSSMYSYCSCVLQF